MIQARYELCESSFLRGKDSYFTIYINLGLPKLYEFYKLKHLNNYMANHL